MGDVEFDIQAALLSIQAETFDLEDTVDVLDDPSGERVFATFCRQVLQTYQSAFPSIKFASVFVAGLEPGFLSLLASRPPESRSQRIGKSEADRLASERVRVLSRDEEWNISSRLAFPAPSDLVLVRLVGHDEFYGILLFGHDLGSTRASDFLSALNTSLPLLNRLMAEANFSMRLTRLAAPFEFPDGLVTKESMYGEIVRQACRGFAADGAVLRIKKPNDSDPAGYSLDVEGRYGLVSDEQLADAGVGPSICRSVFDSQHSVTVQALRPDGTRSGFGVHISDDEDKRLRQHGVQTYMIMRLQSELTTDGQPAAIGTLSIFHRLPQMFSRRDISLFRGFCERVADDLALLDQRDANDEISKLLQVQNTLGTRAEIIALLGHDFGHRVFHVKSGLEDFTESCARHWGERLPESVRSEAKALRKSCDELEEIVRQIRLLGQGADESPSVISMNEVFQEIRNRLAFVLQRNNMAFDIKIEGNCQLIGVRGILLQALFNLVINAVDAQRASQKNRKNTIHLTCREVGRGPHRKLEFNIWDEGVGISRVVFPDAQQIFEVGRTSKPPGQGTGIGLPAARSLLGRYFHADLQLADRNKALFQFSIPAPADSK